MDDEATSLGPLRENFSFKKRPDGTFDKTTVVCKLCKKEFAYHRSYSSLKYHLNAKHVAASTAVPTANFSVASSGTNKRFSQPTLDQMTGFRAKIRLWGGYHFLDYLIEDVPAFWLIQQMHLRQDLQEQSRPENPSESDEMLGAGECSTTYRASTWRRRTERARKRSSFLANPFGFPRWLLGQQGSGRLEYSQKEVDNILHSTLSDPDREDELGPQKTLLEVPVPTTAFNTSELTRKQVQEAPTTPAMYHEAAYNFLPFRLVVQQRGNEQAYSYPITASGQSQVPYRLPLYKGVATVFVWVEQSNGLGKEALAESGSPALRAAVAFARGQQSEQSMSWMGGISDYLGGSAAAS
ncbi:hypothetical protein NFI96_007486 [Prochilodus magdalenae]|nr:hypothetical protein NFI96_007486 [Prochilodus magdalenae]